MVPSRRACVRRWCPFCNEYTDSATDGPDEVCADCGRAPLRKGTHV
jgi:hypothetical protein